MESIDSVGFAGGMPMSTHDAEYFRQRRRAQGIRKREPFSARGFMQRAIELRRLEQQPWPKNLFGEPASIATILAVAAQLSEQADEDPIMCARADAAERTRTMWRRRYGTHTAVALMSSTSGQRHARTSGTRSGCGGRPESRDSSLTRSSTY
jgi:hypothetical protein